MKDVQELKQEANVCFKDGRYQEALRLYDECLHFKDLNKELKLIIQNNKAQCFLNTDNYNEALKVSLEVLEICPSDPKALYRCSQAYEGLGKLKEALQTAKMLIYVDPKNKQAQDLIRRLEARVTAYITEAESLTGRITKMFELIKDDSCTNENKEKALNNLTALAKENPRTALSLLWGHPDFFSIFSILSVSEHTLVVACHRLIAQIIQQDPDKGLIVLDKLTPKYFINGIYSRNVEHSLEKCRFLACLLESLTQLKAYHEAKEAANSNKNIQSKKVAPVAYPRYKLGPKVETPVEEILEHMVHCVNNYRLGAKTRDSILEMLVRFIPSDKGIGWSNKFLKSKGALECSLEVACACGTTSLKNWRSRRIKCGETNPASEKGEDKEDPSGGRLATTSDTRMTLACLLAKTWDDLTSDKARDEYTKICSDFIYDLFADHFLETKVEAASVIGTLFLGPYEVGSSIVSREGILDGLFLLTQCSNKLYQTVALDTIVLSTHKKQQCMGIVSKAVPLLQSLYKSEHDGTRVRALVALCKLGAAGGSDTTVKGLTEGSTLLLLKACRRLLLGIEQPDPDVEEVGANKTAGVKLNADGEVELDDEEDDDEADEVKGVPVRKLKLKENFTDKNLGARSKDPESVHWAIEGIAYLSLNAEVKEEIVGDSEFIATLLLLAEHGPKESTFALASVLAHLTNSLERQQIEPELLELAKFSKQHIPEEHEMDSFEYAKKRRLKLVDIGLPSALYQLTMRTTGLISGSQLGLSELISRIYLACAELVECRGKLAQSGAGKALLKLAVDSNTENGKILASQALARLTITADPRITFPGQRSFELVRRLLQLLSIDCSALQTYEGLLALTNVASLSDVHRHRILAEHGLPLIDHYLFDEHELLRRGAAECMANLAQSHGFVVSCGGKLPLDDMDLAKKLDRLKSSTERVKLLVLYCSEFDDLLLVRAAAGALATMSYDPGIIEKITNTSSWYEILQTLAGHPAYSIQYRAAYILHNFVLYGERSLAEYICNSNMLEVIMSLSQLPDIQLNDDIPNEELTINHGYSDEYIRKQCVENRLGTKNCATKALQRLNEYGLVQKA